MCQNHISLEQKGVYSAHNISWNKKKQNTYQFSSHIYKIWTTYKGLKITPSFFYTKISITNLLGHNKEKINKFIKMKFKIDYI